MRLPMSGHRGEAALGPEREHEGLQLLDGRLFVMLAEGFIVVGIERGYDEPLA